MTWASVSFDHKRPSDWDCSFKMWYIYMKQLSTITSHGARQVFLLFLVLRDPLLKSRFQQFDLSAVNDKLAGTASSKWKERAAPMEVIRSHWKSNNTAATPGGNLHLNNVILLTGSQFGGKAGTRGPGVCVWHCFPAGKDESSRWHRHLTWQNVFVNSLIVSWLEIVSCVLRSGTGEMSLQNHRGWDFL